jgi:integral membrane sensor domain MASE1
MQTSTQPYLNFTIISAMIRGFLQEAIAIVFSSIFNKFGIQCTIAGGQSAAYWMRMPIFAGIKTVADHRQEKISYKLL